MLGRTQSRPGPQAGHACSKTCMILPRLPESKWRQGGKGTNCYKAIKISPNFYHLPLMITN